MLSVDDAKSIAASWRPRFANEAEFELSWSRYMDSATVPDRARLESWLAQDLAKSQVKHAGIVTEPLVPTPSTYLQTDCPHCHGNRYVRVEVPLTDPRFGKALPCPACNDGRPSENLPATEPTTTHTQYRCSKCGQDQNAAARDTCTNPVWHTPNANGLPHPTINTLVRRF